MYCQNQIEDNGKCTIQCEHCKKYYAPLELDKAAFEYAKTDNTPSYEFTTITLTSAFIAGAEWQEKQMYSEDEVLDLLYKFNASVYFPSEEDDIINWFKTFKKNK